MDLCADIVLSIFSGLVELRARVIRCGDRLLLMVWLRPRCAGMRDGEEFRHTELEWRLAWEPLVIPFGKNNRFSWLALRLELKPRYSPIVRLTCEELSPLIHTGLSCSLSIRSHTCNKFQFFINWLQTSFNLYVRSIWHTRRITPLVIYLWSWLRFNFRNLFLYAHATTEAYITSTLTSDKWVLAIICYSRYDIKYHVNQTHNYLSKPVAPSNDIDLSSY